MSKAPIVSPDHQSATFIELFFDLVFVFAITQIAHHAGHHLDAWSLFGTVVVFWLLWWAWTQFTWALNAANTEHHHVRVATLVATGVAFVMATSIAHAFSDGAVWFAGAYILVRVIGLGLYLRVATHDVDHLHAVRSFALWSVLGLAAVAIGAFLPSGIRPWVWLGAVALDFLAAFVAGRYETWNLHAEHFAERHGLIIIIALGESLIVAGVAVGGLERTPTLLFSGLLAVTATCLLWWSYFGWVKDALEEGLVRTGASRQETYARDVYSLGHFPLVCGIIGFAVGLQGIVAGGVGTVGRSTALALGVGIALIIGSTALALLRAARVVLWPRIGIGLGLAALLPLLAPAEPTLLLGVLCVGLVLLLVVEQVTCTRDRCETEIMGESPDEEPAPS